MKKFILRFLKLAIFFVFLWNTGVIQLIYETQKNKPPEKELTWQEQRTLAQSVQKFWSEKYRLAQAKDRQGAKYSPYDYFADMTEFHLKFKGISAGVNYDISSCQSLMNSELGQNRRYSYDDLTLARDKYYLAIGQADQVSGNQKQIDWRVPATKVLYWMINMYWHNLIFVLFLFVLWDAQRRGKLVIKNPLSIIINTILHPLTLSIIFFQYMSTKIMESEFRRTKDKFLTVLSEDELQFVQTVIRRGFSRKEFKALLAVRGSMIRHSLAWGLMATILITILPQQVKSTVKADLSAVALAKAERQVTQICVSSLAQHVLVVDNYQPDGGANHLAVDLFIEKIFILQFFINVSFVRLREFFFEGFNLWTKIQHVPLCNS
jgi:hypothetical protein